MGRATMYLTGIKETEAKTAKMWQALVESSSNITKYHALGLAQDAAAKHRAVPHPSGLWHSKGKQVPVHTWWLTDRSNGGRGRYYAAWQVSSRGGAYGKAAGYVEYYTRDKARQKKGKVLARELDKFYGMTGNLNGRVAWRLYEKDLPLFERDLVVMKESIEREFKEV